LHAFIRAPKGEELPEELKNQTEYSERWKNYTGGLENNYKSVETQL